MKDDLREDCILHANCQGEPLARLLMASPAFAARWRIHLYTNYTRDAIPESMLKSATLFLYQHLGPAWNELGSAYMLSRLGKKTRSVCIPNMFFLGYWPFWTNASPMNFGDMLLDKLHDSCAGKPEILRVYLHGDVRKLADLEGIVRRTLEMEFAKEELCDVKTVGFVAENWKKMRLFQTVNHPDTPLLLHAAQGLLAHLDLPLLGDVACREFSFDYEGFELPIHPRVAAFHGLSFAGEDAEYAVFGRKMTFAQYISRYIDCRLNHMEDTFLGYLQMV